MNWGIRGTGGIAHLFAQGLAAAQTGRLVAVGSRTREAAQAFGATDAVEAAHRHASYEDLLADAAVEVVSIALPNHLHAAWTMAAADAGKPILCEKPLTVHQAEWMTSSMTLACFRAVRWLYRAARCCSNSARTPSRSWRTGRRAASAAATVWTSVSI